MFVSQAAIRSTLFMPYLSLNSPEGKRYRMADQTRHGELTFFVPRVLEVNTRNGISPLAWSRRMNQCGPHPNRF
jgi:hypothetical protein